MFFDVLGPTHGYPQSIPIQTKESISFGVPLMGPRLDQRKQIDRLCKSVNRATEVAFSHVQERSPLIAEMLLDLLPEAF